MKLVLLGGVLNLFAFTVGAHTLTGLGNLPLYFEAGCGPDASPAQFTARLCDRQVVLSPVEAQIILRKAGAPPATVRMRFAGANAQAKISGDAEQPGKINYLTGRDPAQWRTGVPTFGKVRVEGLYPGIGLVYYGNQQQLEYDFTIAPGANPNAVRIHFDGVDTIAVGAAGELILTLGDVEIRQLKPVIYQTAGGARKEIEGGYQMVDAHTVAFAIGQYDRTLPLVIDPILSYSTYFGGTAGDTAWAVALDTNGFIYVAGETFSKQFFTNGPAFSTTNAFQTNFQGGTLTGDAFVAKINNLGSYLVYLTYLGGSADDGAFGIAVDAAGDAYVTGFTDSPNFPVTNSIPGGVPGIPNSTHISGTLNTHVGYYPVDAFVAELNTNGSGLVYSTYLGGSSSDAGIGIAVDSTGNAYVTGVTYSTNFPVKNAISYHLAGRTNLFLDHLACTNSLYYNANAFIAKIAPNGTNLVYSSYFGGTNFDEGTGIAVDSLNSVYVTGFTASTNFPNMNSFQKYLNGATNNTAANDAFVAKFDPTGTNLVYSTFLGGVNADMALGIAVDGSGNAYVTGSTTSTNFPNTAGDVPFLSNGLTNNSYYGYIVATNAFLTQIQWNGTTAGIGYSAVFGGTNIDIGYGVAVDPAGNAFVVGYTSSTNFPCYPTTNTSYLRVTNSGGNDVFVIAFNADASALLFSGFFGGSSDDFGYGIAVDPDSNAYIVGQTLSTNFPTLNASQTHRIGTNDAFLAKILLTLPPMPPLAIAGSTNAIITISWPANPFYPELPQYYKLEYNTNLLGTNWILFPSPPTLTNGSYVISGSPPYQAVFFRLHTF